MRNFRKWCKQQLDDLDLIPLVDPLAPEWIIEQAADRACRLGLAELYRKAEGLKTFREARVYLAECIAAEAPNGKPTGDLLTVKQAARLLNVSDWTIYDLCEIGRLRHQRIGIGRGTIRIRKEDLAGCLAEPEPTRYKHLTL